mmetsp:Transcript_26412/g.70602  ORF Transcript_26412/g.70602 Transcript_26412/m.70602 type:complete len:190 (+) Transcript_26412:709-1278(+)
MTSDRQRLLIPRIFNACLCLCPHGQLHTISERDAPSLPLVIRAARSVPLLRSLVPFLEVALRPPYLSDVHPQRLKCPSVLESEEHGYWLGQTRYEDRVIAELERQEAEGYRQQWPLMKDVTFERAPKEFVVIKPEQRHHLRRIDLSGIPFWSDQVFDSGRPQGVARDAAWQGTVVGQGPQQSIPSTHIP